jgi:hypothetical protein
MSMGKKINSGRKKYRILNGNKIENNISKQQ